MTRAGVLALAVLLSGCGPFGGVRSGASLCALVSATEAEAALSANFDAAALDGLTVPEDNMLSDLHGSATYRANLVKVVTKRAVKKAKA